MQKYLKYAVVAASIAAVLAPSLAFAVLATPTVPVEGKVITTRTVETLINSIVNFLITISVVVAVGVIVWGGLRYMQDPEKGKPILKNGLIGVVIILGVGLILNTISRFINTGGAIN